MITYGLPVFFLRPPAPLVPDKAAKPPKVAKPPKSDKGKGKGIGGGGNTNSISIVTAAAVYAAQPSLAQWGDSWNTNWGG